MEVKSTTVAARMAWLYRHPWAVILASPALALAHTGFIVLCWLRAGVLEPLLLLPLILVSRVTYVAGMCAGAIRWLQFKRSPETTVRGRPRWE